MKYHASFDWFDPFRYPTQIDRVGSLLRNHDSILHSRSVPQERRRSANEVVRLRRIDIEPLCVTAIDRSCRALLESYLLDRLAMSATIDIYGVFGGIEKLLYVKKLEFYYSDR